MKISSKYEPKCFRYKVAISKTSDAISSGYFHNSFPGTELVTIESTDFPTLSKCERALHKLMNLIGNNEILDGQKPVLVIQTNPKFDNTSDDLPNSNWGEGTILKIFLVSAEKVKKESDTLLYSISGSIEMEIIST